MKSIAPDEISKIEQEIDDSSLDESIKSRIKGLIAGQSLLLDLFEKLVESSGYQRTKIFQELAKILNIDLKGQNNSQSNDSSDSSEANQNFDKQQENEESHTGENGSDLKEKSSDEDLPKKKHPKRKNGEFQPVASHTHFHENLEPGDQCPKCLKGRVYSFREKVIPISIGRSPLAYEEHRLQTLRCNACGMIFEPKLPKEIPKEGHFDPSAQAVLTLLHYKIGVPFSSIADLQKIFHQKMSSAQLWEVIEQVARAIEPIYQELQYEAACSQLFYTDDTTSRVLSHYPINKENRKKKRKKKDPKDRVGSYSSIIIGCSADSREIYLFYHGRKYAGENLADLLVDRDSSINVPIQMKDASTMNVPANTEILEAKCNAHAIRKFKNLKDIYPNWCGEVLRRYAEVNEMDQMLLKNGVEDKERLAYHKKYSLPLMEKIKDYLTGLIKEKMVEPNSGLGQAIAYFHTHYKELTAFCCIEGAPFDNNKSERGLKMIIRLRKTSMFYKTERGAKIAGMLQSVLYTAQEASVNVLDYLYAILKSPENVRKDPASYLPWSFHKNTLEGKIDPIDKLASLETAL